MKFIPILVLLAGWMTLSSFTAEAGRVRHVPVKKDEVIPVKTASTIATIIQVPDRPNSVVIGNQSAFQVEYLDTAVTIKSLQSRATGNLYIYTDYRRYSVTLVTGEERDADYIVYLEEAKMPALPLASKSGSVHWKPFRKAQKNDGMEIKFLRMGTRADGYGLIEFTVLGRKNRKFDPGWLWMTQEGKIKTIQNIFLNALAFPENEKISGTLVLLKTDFNPDKELNLEFRVKKTVSILIPGRALWK